MKKHIFFILKNCILTLIILFLLVIINNILMTKNFFNSEYPTTATYKNFYKLDRDTVDVLFLGSSHCVTSFDPQVLYDEYGITSYNLGSGAQSIMVSYYWLEEALRYQSPKAVVLDTYMLFWYEGQKYFNSTESSIRMAIDPMRWSKVKWNAVRDICEHDSEHSISSYFFINERYHNRWENLTQADFQFAKMYRHQDLKGYSAIPVRAGKEEYIPLESGRTDEKCNIHYYTVDYLEKIVNLCEEKGIELILVKTPAIMQNEAKYNTTLEFAKENGLAFWDLNLQEHYNACGFEFVQDMSGGGHANVWGAQKITKYIGKLLKEQGLFSEVCVRPAWEESKEYHKKVLYDCELTQITNIDDYLQKLKREDYTVFIAISADVDFFKQEGELNKFRNALGVEMGLQEPNSYMALLHDGVILTEEVSPQINYYDVIDNCDVDYHIACSDDMAERNCSILIDNVEHSINKQGINIVVYNNDRMLVVDSINYLNGKMQRE